MQKMSILEETGPVKQIDKCQTRMEAALPIRVKFFFTRLPFYLGHNMWNSFNRWAAEESPGEQKLVSSVSSSSCG